MLRAAPSMTTRLEDVRGFIDERFRDGRSGERNARASGRDRRCNPVCRGEFAARRQDVGLGTFRCPAAGVVAWKMGDAFRVAEIVDLDEFYGGVELSVSLATRNGVVSYAILRRDPVARPWCVGRLAGGTSVEFPASFWPDSLASYSELAGGAASSYALFPIYFSRMATADITLSILIHLGIWTAVGAASGVAFGIGSGSRRVFAQSLVGGITGGALGTLLFDMSGAFFPLAHTERPLAEAAGTRLAGDLLLSLCVAVGIVIVACQRPPVTATKT